jgi:predicted nucleic acid-binding protein
MSEIICNATPLIAFAKIGQLPLMKKVVGRVVIPRAVAEEITNYTGDMAAGKINLPQESWIQVESLQSNEQMQLLLPILDKGEAEVIALALEKRARLVLIDELTGRKVAESLQLKVTGSVGLLIRAKERREIAAVKPYLEAMHEAGIYFSQRFINSVLRHTGEM